jgi:hypothetical protein
MSEFQKLIHTDTLGAKPKWWTPSATDLTYQMKAGDQIMLIGLHTVADDSVILTLPSLAESAGKFYYVCIPDVNNPGTTGDCSVYEKETGAELTTYGDLDADGDYFMLYSDGRKWRVFVNGVA